MNDNGISLVRFLMDVFDILEDLSDNLGLSDFYHFLMINELTYELEYKIIRKVEYYYMMIDWVEHHDVILDPLGGYLHPSLVTHYVCYVGEFDVLKWYHRNAGNKFDYDEIFYAGIGGHLEIVKWLHFKSDIPDDCYAMDYVCANGQLHVAKWLHDNHHNKCSDNAIDYAAKNGHLDTVKWLYQNYKHVGCSEWAIIRSYSNGHLEITKWLCDNVSYEFVVNTMERAYYWGWKDTADFLRENYIKIDD